MMEPQNPGDSPQNGGDPKTFQIRPKIREKPQNGVDSLQKETGSNISELCPPPPKIMESHPEIMKEPKILEIHPRRGGGTPKRTVGNGPENGVERAEMSSIHPKI